jgi:DNA repair exonuclease SbcCD ATPase subunit
MWSPLDTVEQLEQEIRRLEKQRDEALTQVRDAEGQLEGLNEGRIELAIPAFAGDEIADKNLMILEEEASKLSRKVQLAKNTVSQLDKAIGATKEELAEEKRHLARERYRELERERSAWMTRIDARMADLTEAFREYSALEHKLIEQAQIFDENVAHYPSKDLIRRKLEDELGRYL